MTGHQAVTLTCTRCGRTGAQQQVTPHIVDDPEGWAELTIAGRPVRSLRLCPPCSTALDAFLAWTAWRESVRRIVADRPEIDIVIVHHADGSNDFFSAKPDVERCERWRVIEVCRGIIRVLQEMPRKQRSDAGTSKRCGDGLPGSYDTRCPDEVPS